MFPPKNRNLHQANSAVAELNTLLPEAFIQNKKLPLQGFRVSGFVLAFDCVGAYQGNTHPPCAVSTGSRSGCTPGNYWSGPARMEVAGRYGTRGFAFILTAAPHVQMQSTSPNWVGLVWTPSIQEGGGRDPQSKQWCVTGDKFPGSAFTFKVSAEFSNSFVALIQNLSSSCNFFECGNI